MPTAEEGVELLNDFSFKCKDFSYQFAGLSKVSVWVIFDQHWNAIVICA